MTLPEMMRRFPTEKHCIDYLEKVRWNGTPVCPYCGHTCTDNKRKDGRYNCGSCHRAFRVTVGTLFHKTHQSLQQWFLLIVLMLHAKKGASGHQLAKDCGLKQPTVWLMTMKIRKAMEFGNGGLLEGIVEIDETYIGGKPRKKNTDGTGRSGRKGGGSAGKDIVLGAVERGGDVKAERIESVNKRTIQRFLRTNTRGATIYSDSYYVYRNISDKQINHHERFVDGELHTNSIESFWANLKRGIFGQFHHISPRHLNAYIAEFAYKFNRRRVDNTFDETVQWMVATSPAL